MMEMRYYILAMLYTGQNPTTDPARRKELQAGHMANMGRLHQEGKLILAGPFKGGGDLEGLFLLDTGSVDEAREWCASDPAIAAGELRVEFHQWYSAKGIGIMQATGPDPEHP
ncbi:MAG TPA: YciI family protein [Candidatus Eisenbacteria bacterium]|nr:YciI family protein [Candidatus Eisenbacteria bacterium]